MQWLNELPFADNRVLQIGFLLACGIAALIVLALVYRLAFAHRLRVPGGRTRQPRLGLVDAFSLDGQRQLVLVRRDNVEHLVMIGGPNDVLVESQINRAAVSARENTQASPLLVPSAPVRQVPLPAQAIPEAPAPVAAKVPVSPPQPAPAPVVVPKAPAPAQPSAPASPQAPVPVAAQPCRPSLLGRPNLSGRPNFRTGAQTSRARTAAPFGPTAVNASAGAGAIGAGEFAAPAPSGGPSRASGDASADRPGQRGREPGDRSRA